MVVDAARIGRERMESLLGYAQVLEAETVKQRRTVLAGCPVRLTKATHGSLVDILGETFALNLANLVVDELVAPLNLEAVNSDDDQASGEVWDCWQRSELSAGTEGLFTAAAADGQAFLIADFDDQGQPTAWVNLAYDGTVGLEVKAVDPDGAILVAIKHEREILVRDRRTSLLVRLVDHLRSMVGMPGRSAVDYLDRMIRTEYVFDPFSDTTAIRHFITDPGRAEYQAVEVDGRWVEVAPGTPGDEWPFGMPVVPFVAPSGGELSDLEDPQRLVNAAALDLAQAARVDSLRIAYTIDCRPMMGGTTGKSQSEPIYLVPGVAIEFQSLSDERKGQVGTLPPSDLSALMEALKLRVEMMLMLARTSTFVLPWRASGTVYPSGAALRITTAPFRDKVERYQERWGVGFIRLFELWQRMLGMEPSEVLPVWQSLSYTTLAEDLQNVMAMQQLGLPREHQAAVLGMTPDQKLAWDEESSSVSALRLSAVEAAGE